MMFCSLSAIVCTKSERGKIILHKKKVICRLSELSFNRARQRLARQNIAANKGLQFGIDRSNHRAQEMS